MDIKDFKIRIIDFYKGVDKPIINNIYNDNTGQNVLELSTLNEISLFSKTPRNKNTWKIKDKRVLLKEIDSFKKRRIKEMKNQLTHLDDTTIQNTNNKLLTDIESINTLKKNIEDDNIYDKLKNLTLLSNYSNNKPILKGGAGPKPQKQDKEQLNIIKLNIDTLSDSDDYIEIFSNK